MKYQSGVARWNRETPDPIAGPDLLTQGKLSDDLAVQQFPHRRLVTGVRNIRLDDEDSSMALAFLNSSLTNTQQSRDMGIRQYASGFHGMAPLRLWAG